MDFHTMKRKELQALCKNHKIPANLTNLEMANRLASLLEVDKEKPQKQRVNSVKSCLKNLDDLGDADEKNIEDKLAKKIRFSPEDQTFEFEKTNPREMRLARRKSVVLAEDKINTGEKVDESLDVDNQVTSTRNRGRGRKPEQADVEEAKLLPKKKAEAIDVSKKASRKRTSGVADCEVHPLVDARRHKATKNTASEATKPVTRRSVRIVERPDESASVTEQVEIVKLPKRKARSDCQVNQEMEKAPTRCLKRNISKDACAKAVEEVKERGNGISRVMRNTRQQKGDKGLNETVSAAESAPVEKAEELKEQGNEKAKVTRKTRQQKGDIGLNETVSATERAAVVEKASTRCLRRNTSKDAGEKSVEEATEWGNKKGRVTRTTQQQKGDTGLNETVSATESADVVGKGQQRRSTRVAIKRCSLAPGELNGKKSEADVQERGVTLKSKQSRKQENSSCPGKSDEQTRCTDKRKLSTKNHGEDLQTDIEVAPLAKFIKSVKFSEDENSETYSVCEASDHQSRLCDESSTIDDNQDNNQPLHQTTPPTLLLKEFELANAEGNAELINESSTMNSPSTEPPENAVLSTNEGILVEMYCLDGQRTEGDEAEAYTDKEEESNAAEILDAVSSEDARVVLHPSSEFQSSPCRATLTASRSFTEDIKAELENTVSKADRYVQIDPALTSTSIKKYTGTSLPECDSGFQEGSSIKSTESEDHTLCSETILSNEQVQLIWTSDTVGFETENENQSGDVLEECITLDFYNLKGQTSKDASTVQGLESYLTLNEFQSWLDKPAAALETSTLTSNEPVNPQADTCIDHLVAHECKNLGQIEEAEGVIPTPMVDERSEGIDTYISDRSDDPAECKRIHKQGPEDESDSPLAVPEQTYDIASLFQFKDAEQDSVVISNELAEGRNITKVSDFQQNDNHEDDGVLDDQNLEVYVEKGENVVYNQEAEGVKPSAVVDERSEDVDTYISDGSDGLAECERSRKQGIKEESNLQLTFHEERNEITSLFQLENDERGSVEKSNSQLAIYEDTNGGIASLCQLNSAEWESEGTYGNATFFQLENAERDRVGISNELEGRSITEVSDAQLNDNPEDATLADQNMEVYEKRGTEEHAVSGIVTEPAVCMEEAFFTGPTTQVHKVSTPPSLDNNSNLELVAGIKNLEELAYADFKDAFMDEGYGAGESDLQNLTEMYSGCTAEKMHTLPQVATKPIGIHDTGHMDQSESDSEISSVDESREEEDVAVTPNVLLIVPCELEDADATMHEESEEQLLGLAVLERISEQTGGQDTGEILDKVAHTANDNDLHDTNDKANFSLPPELEGAYNKEYMEASIHNGHSSVDSEGVLPCSGGLSDSPLKGAEGLTSVAQVKDLFEEVAVNSVTSDRIEDNTGSEGSLKQGLIKESNLQLSGHEDTHCGNLAEELTQGPVPVHEGSENKDIELTSYETSLFMGDDTFRAKTGTLDYPTPETIFASVFYDKYEPVQQKDEDFSHPEQRKIFEVVTGIIDRVLEDENASTDEANEEVFVDLMKEAKGLVAEICSTAETLEGGNGGIEPLVTASFPEMSSITPDDEFKNDVKGISSKDVLKGCKQECPIGSVVDANPAAVNMESDCLGGSFQFLTPLLEPSHPVEEMHATEHACVREDVNRENTEFELAGLKTEDETFICEAEELHYTTSETGLPMSGIDTRAMEEGIIGNEKVAAELIKQDCDCGDFTILSTLVCASKLQKEAAVPNSHYSGICQVDHEDTRLPEHCRTYEVSEKGNCTTFEAIIPDVYDEDLPKIERGDTCHPEHSTTSELLTSTFEHLGDENASVNQPISDILRDLKEDEVPVSSEEEIRSTIGNRQCCNVESEVQLCVPHQEMDATMMDDQYRSEVEGISKEDEIMPQQKMQSLNDETTPDVYDEDLSKVEHEDTSIPEHFEDDNASAIQPMLDMLEDSKEVEVHASSEEEIKSTGENLECRNGEFDVQPCGLHPEMNKTMIDDQYKSENVEGISKEAEIMPQEEMKPLNDEITPDVYDEDLSKLEHEDTCVPEHSRTSELVTGTFEHLEDDNASVIQPMSDMLDDLKEDEVRVSASSEEEIKSTGGDQDCSIGKLQMNTTMIHDQYNFENVKGTFKEDEIVPQPEMKPLNDEIRDAKLGKVEKSSKKPASATNQKKRSILIHGTPRRPIKISDMKENSTAQLKRDRLANPTASKPLAGRKALGELSRWRP